jgi:hypothetical protein
MYVQPGEAEPEPRMTPLSHVDAMPARPADAQVLFPNVGYKQQLGVLIFGHVYSRMNGDMALSNKLRVWIDGQQGEVEVPDDQQVRFYDPSSGYTYVARLYGDDIIDNKVVERGIASRMIQHANALMAVAYQVERDTAGNTILDAYGTPILLLDGAGQPQMLNAERAGELTRYVGLMDAARQIAHKVGYGPL